jgi:hypothetical protein
VSRENAGQENNGPRYKNRQRVKISQLKFGVQIAELEREGLIKVGKEDTLGKSRKTDERNAISEQCSMKTSIQASWLKLTIYLEQVKQDALIV